MKPTLFCAALFLSLRILAQTPELERAWIASSRANNTLTAVQAAEYKTALEKLLKTGLYPTLPYDTSTRKIIFEDVLECPGIPKAVIFKRIQEWCALHYYGEGQALLYQDLESGKIIANGAMEIVYEDTQEKLFGGETRWQQSADCSYRVTFTVKEDKFKVSMQELEYSTENPGRIETQNGDPVYIPASRNEYDFASIFPIMKKNMYERRGFLNMVRTSLQEFEVAKGNLLRHVNAWEQDNKF